ncbi:hypothetical protein [Bacteroides acidifaciens]|uniref:hypothetical protein n=1 Tax=Bacteroides acidifaciens TaxID=85831 RepID=UPI0026ED68E2|nr:hypothetical protein [Bacteroides acidifaciens]
MRIPNTKLIPDKKADINTVTIEKPILIPRLPVITTDKQRIKLIMTIERLVRQNIDYKDIITFLRKNLDMNQCEFFENFKAGKRRGMIEIHHAPFDLFSIVEVVMDRMEKEVGYIDEYPVADQVLRMHYEGLIGLIPLSVTCHQLVHDGKLIVPLNCVYGRFVEFTREYYDELGEDRLAVLNENIQLTKNIKRSDFNILNVTYIYTKVDGFSLPQPVIKTE